MWRPINTYHQNVDVEGTYKKIFSVQFFDGGGGSGTSCTIQQNAAAISLYMLILKYMHMDGCVRSAGKEKFSAK